MLKFIDSTRFKASYYQVSLIILLKEFIKINVNMSIIIKTVKRVELKTKTLSAVLNRKTLKII